MAPGATGFEMSFIIRLNSITFRTFFTDPLFVVAVFSSEMFLYPNKIAKGMAWIMVQATRLRANENSLLHHRSLSLE